MSNLLTGTAGRVDILQELNKIPTGATYNKRVVLFRND